MSTRRSSRYLAHRWIDPYMGDDKRKNRQLWLEEQNEGPLMATAIHAGHDIRGELLPLIALDEAERAHEEDPYTDYWVKIIPTWLVPTRSRFEVDLNRPREEAVYREPEMAWGLHLWKQQPSEAMIERSLEEYDEFYKELGHIVDRTRHSRAEAVRARCALAHGNVVVEEPVLALFPTGVRAEQ